MLDGDKQGAHLKVFAGRSAGYVINTSLAETRYNKCAYIFDGATTYKLNQGCGDAAPPPTTCDNRMGAFNNICTSTNKTCTIDDPEIQPNRLCESILKPGVHHRPWLKHKVNFVFDPCASGPHIQTTECPKQLGGVETETVKKLQPSI
jgi:hypothetical protein